MKSLTHHVRLACRVLIWSLVLGLPQLSPLTGRYPFRYGLQTAVIPSVSAYGLDTTEWLLPQALKDAGYTTAIIGKWHLSHADKKR